MWHPRSESCEFSVALGEGFSPRIAETDRCYQSVGLDMLGASEPQESKVDRGGHDAPALAPTAGARINCLNKIEYALIGSFIQSTTLKEADTGTAQISTAWKVASDPSNTSISKFNISYSAVGVR